jgi:hypothetical protein
LIAESAFLNPKDESKVFDVFGKLMKRKSDPRILIKIVKLEGLKVAEQNVSRKLWFSEPWKVIQRLLFCSHQISPGALLFYEENSLPKQVEKATPIAEQSDRFLKAGDSPAGHSEDFKEFVIECLRLASLVMCIFPLKEKAFFAAELISEAPTKGFSVAKLTRRATKKGFFVTTQVSKATKKAFFVSTLVRKTAKKGLFGPKLIRKPSKKVFFVPMLISRVAKKAFFVGNKTFLATEKANKAAQLPNKMPGEAAKGIRKSVSVHIQTCKDTHVRCKLPPTLDRVT